MKYPILSKNLKEYRKKANLTQKELGKKIHKSEISIRKYESGKINIPPMTLFDISTVLNVSTQSLLGSDYNNYKVENNLTDISHYDKASKMLKQLLQLLEKAVSRSGEIDFNIEDYLNNYSSKIAIDYQNDPKYLLSNILDYLKNTEKYFSPLDVNISDAKVDSSKYFTSQQVENIIKKVTELVKYEIYKIEHNIK